MDAVKEHTEEVSLAVRQEFWRALDEPVDEVLVDRAVRDVLECSGLGAGEHRWSHDDVTLAVRRVLLDGARELALRLRAGRQ